VMAQYLESGQVVVHLRLFSLAMEAVASSLLTTKNDTLVTVTS
jgi:predicted SpoU family rRNA methylase